MAIKFEKPKTKIHSNSERTKRIEERIAYFSKRAKKSKTEYLMPNFKDKASRKRKAYAWHRSMGKIYPEVSLSKDIHPLMYRLWLYLKNYNNAYDVDKKQHINKGDLVKWGVARLVWIWVYQNMPWPVGCKGGPKGRNKAEKNREDIITQVVTALVDDKIKEVKKKTSMTPTQRRQYYRLKAKAKKALSDDKKQTSSEVVPTV